MAHINLAKTWILKLVIISSCYNVLRRKDSFGHGWHGIGIRKLEGFAPIGVPARSAGDSSM
jgi:hypothetical protein